MLILNRSYRSAASCCSINWVSLCQCLTVDLYRRRFTMQRIQSPPHPINDRYLTEVTKIRCRTQPNPGTKKQVTCPGVKKGKTPSEQQIHLQSSWSCLAIVLDSQSTLRRTGLTSDQQAITMHGGCNLSGVRRGGAVPSLIRYSAHGRLTRKWSGQIGGTGGTSVH